MICGKVIQKGGSFLPPFWLDLTASQNNNPDGDDMKKISTKRLYALIVIASMLLASLPTVANEPVQIFNTPVELATLSPPNVFSIPPAANLQEALALLPQYATITTNPPSAHDRLPISWQLCHTNQWGDFNPEIGFGNNFAWLGTLPPGVVNPFGIILEGSIGVFNAASVFEVYADAVNSTLIHLPVSNATTPDDIMAVVEAIIEGTSITAEWNINPWNPYFEFRPATLTSTGEVVARIRLTQGDEFRVITMRRNFTHPIAAYYRFIRAAIDNLNVTNATTAADFYNAVERVLRGTGVEISWYEDFIRTDATPHANGTITGVMRLTAGTEYADFSVNRTIPFLRMWSDVLLLVGHRVSTLRTSNQTTLADITAHMQTIVPPYFYPRPEIEWHGDLNLTPATETKNGRITATATITLSTEPEPYVFVFDRAIPRSRIANEVFLEWNYGTLVEPRPDNFWPATRGADGMILEDTCLAFYYVDGARAILGRAANMSARLALNVPNRAATGSGSYSEADWIFHAGDPYRPPRNVANSAGWVITLSTEGWENINFSARQASSGQGPGGFGFAYRIGTSSEWISYGDGSWPLVSVRTDYPRDRVLGETFRNFQLPEALANQPVVQIKLYIDGRVRLGGGILSASEGNTSINNIVFRGERITVANCDYCGNASGGCKYCNPPVFDCKHCEDSGACCDNCTPHDFSANWTVRNPATCKEYGIEFRVCKRDNCNHEETRSIQKADCYCYLPVVTIITQPAPFTTVIQGAITETLYVEAIFSTPAALTFEWFMVSTPIRITTGASLAIPSDLAPGTHEFYVRIGAEGVDSSVYSDRAMVTVIPYQCSETFIVTFDPGDGFFTTTPPAIMFASGGALDILPRATGMSKPGYRFTGWFEDIADETTRRRDFDRVSANVTLHARWTPIPNPSNFRVGDAGMDGRITSADATLIARHIVGHDVTICLLAADIDGDGEVTISDITLLARWLVGHNIHHLIAH